MQSKVGYEDDAGGNAVTVDFFGTQTNLHSVWDTSIITKWNADPVSAAVELQTIISENPNLVAE
jgi:hypothetical protein